MSDDTNKIQITLHLDPPLLEACHDVRDRLDDTLCVGVSKSAAYRQLLRDGLDARGFEQVDGEWVHTGSDDE